MAKQIFFNKQQTKSSPKIKPSVLCVYINVASALGKKKKNLKRKILPYNKQKRKRIVNT